MAFRGKNGVHEYIVFNIKLKLIFLNVEVNLTFRTIMSAIANLDYLIITDIYFQFFAYESKQEPNI